MVNVIILFNIQEIKMNEFNFYQQFNLKYDERFIIVGDVHGDYKGLQEILKQNNISKNTHIFGVGDIIDRGLNSAACLNEFLYNEHYHSVLGNHEKMMIDSIDKNTRLHWEYQNGGKSTINELGEAGFLHYREEIMKNFPYIIEINHRGKKFGIVHAGIEVGRNHNDPNFPQEWQNIVKLAEQEEYYRYNMLWDRDVIKKVVNGDGKLIPRVEGVDYVIHGHTPVSEPLIHENRIWIDTNFISNTLTLAEFNYDIDDWDFHQLYY